MHGTESDKQLQAKIVSGLIPRFCLLFQHSLKKCIYLLVVPSEVTPRYWDFANQISYFCSAEISMSICFEVFLYIFIEIFPISKNLIFIFEYLSSYFVGA